jgi:uncharacterized protein YcbX
MVLSEISIYPVKSCAGLQLSSAALDRFGLEGDRRWLLVDTAGRFVSQRELARLALVQVVETDAGLLLTVAGDELQVSRPPTTAMTRPVSVWKDTVLAQDAGNTTAEWLSARLQITCRLVYMPDQSQRAVDPGYATAGETVSFADGFPLLLISQASLDDLNSRLSSPVPMNRFRPNLVVAGCDAFAEDQWRRIRIAEQEFNVAKACARCVMPSIDQATAEKDSEIVRVLASYRRGADRQTYFGQNLLYQHFGALTVGAEVTVLE